MTSEEADTIAGPLIFIILLIFLYERWDRGYLGPRLIKPCRKLPDLWTLKYRGVYKYIRIEVGTPIREATIIEALEEIDEELLSIKKLNSSSEHRALVKSAHKKFKESKK